MLLRFVGSTELYEQGILIVFPLPLPFLLLYLNAELTPTCDVVPAPIPGSPWEKKKKDIN